jgi:hypothetical protein
MVCRECGVELVKPPEAYVWRSSAFARWMKTCRDRLCGPCGPVVAKRRLRAIQRVWNGNRYRRWRAAGCCGFCGEPTSINPDTGQPFALCLRHRLS